MRYYIDNSNRYIGGTDGSPLSANEVPFAPDDARQKWAGTSYLPLSVAVLNAEQDAQIEAEFTPALIAIVNALDPANATAIIAQAKANRKAEL